MKMFVRITLLVAVLSIPCDAAKQTAEVIVIGAGWAGMGAADTLARNGVSFVILEATNRTGGRTHAINFGDSSIKNFVVEMGSNWVSGFGGGSAGNIPGYPPKRFAVNPMQTLAEKNKLTRLLVPGGTNNMLNYKGVFTSDGEVTDKTKQLRIAANAAYDCANRTSIDSEVDMTLRVALDKCGWLPKTSPEWTVDWAFTVDNPGLPAERQSLFSAVPDTTYAWWGNNDGFVHDQHPRGWARLVDAFTADTIPSGDRRLIFNSHVTNINYGCEASGDDLVTVTTSEGKQYTAKHVINTLPVGVMQHHYKTLFTPSLPTAQIRALADDGFVMANLTKVFVQFEEVFWDNSLVRFLVSSEDGEKPSGNFAEWQNLNHESLIPGSQTILFMLGDPQSSLYEGMSDAEVEEAVMKKVNLFAGRTVARPRALFISRHGYDPLSYGAYTGYEPNWKDKYWTDLIRPLSSCDVEKVQFAGEGACDVIGGFTHGALIRGQYCAGRYLNMTGRGDEPLDLCSFPNADNKRHSKYSRGKP
eukprot:m.115129 g.115129  ORF g.115129 m.115129 type:complete len:529 (-) comp28399_c0_seq2:129-1715(-)